jgi:hypothetical protein
MRTAICEARIFRGFVLLAACLPSHPWHLRLPMQSAFLQPILQLENKMLEPSICLCPVMVTLAVIGGKYKPLLLYYFSSTTGCSVSASCDASLLAGKFQFSEFALFSFVPQARNYRGQVGPKPQVASRLYLR